MVWDNNTHDRPIRKASHRYHLPLLVISTGAGGHADCRGIGVEQGDRLENHLSTFILNIDGMDAGDVGIMLDVDHNIATRTGLHCAPLVHTQLGTVDIHGGVRFSIGAFNTGEQVDTAIKAVAAIARWSAGRKR